MHYTGFRRTGFSSSYAPIMEKCTGIGPGITGGAYLVFPVGSSLAVSRSKNRAIIFSYMAVLCFVQYYPGVECLFSKPWATDLSGIFLFAYVNLFVNAWLPKPGIVAQCAGRFCSNFTSTGWRFVLRFPADALWPYSQHIYTCHLEHVANLAPITGVKRFILGNAVLPVLIPCFTPVFYCFYQNDPGRG